MILPSKEAAKQQEPHQRNWLCVCLGALLTAQRARTRLAGQRQTDADKEEEAGAMRDDTTPPGTRTMYDEDTTPTYAHTHHHPHKCNNVFLRIKVAVRFNAHSVCHRKSNLDGRTVLMCGCGNLLYGFYVQVIIIKLYLSIKLIIYNKLKTNQSSILSQHVN